MRQKRNARRALVRKPAEETTWKTRRWKYIKMDLKAKGFEGLECTHVV